jgi:[NiFe] hydrogenase diaphorase moiety large subunit
MSVVKKGPILSCGIGPEEGLKRALSLSRADVISEVRESGLKGRGGAGFPTGVKWNLAAAALGNRKFVVCNADEGEPGTFKDRVLLSDYAGHVFEGMTIAGYVIGSDTGILYLRGEYKYLLKQLEAALKARRKEGLLGKDVLGKKGFHFDIEIRMGSGAYVCGEETALIESMEGHRGEPRNRPPFPVNTGFMGCPTTVNNVETLLLASAILAKGAEWFKKIGTDKSTGSKVFSISGDCERPGVYELPMGITIADLLKEVGGEEAKAVQVGGASGICLPASEFGRKIAFEDVSTGGSVIVFGQGRDMLRVAKNFMEFFVEESCGQCTPCRYGNVTLLEGVKKLEKGECSLAYLRELTALGESIQLASKCGLGQSSPNAFLSIVSHFKEEILGRKKSGLSAE